MPREVELVSMQWQGTGQKVLSEGTFLLSKDYVPYVPKHGTWIFFSSPLKTRMFPTFFILLFISVPMFRMFRLKHNSRQK